MKTKFLLLFFMCLAGCSKTYKNAFGDTITQEQHDRQVAEDAAHDAIIEFMTQCRTAPAYQRPKECPAFP